MSTREEIREGVARFLFEQIHSPGHTTKTWEGATGYVQLDYGEQADVLMQKLHSQGVVIQSKEPYNYGHGDWYYPTEPLIEIGG